MKTVVTDLDGTLLVDGNLPEEAIEKLKIFQKDNRLVLATGRNKKSVKKIFEVIEMDKYKTGALILINGLSFYDFHDGETIMNQSFDEKTVKKIIRIAYLLMFRITIVKEDERIKLNCLYDRIYYLLRYVIKHKPMIKFDKYHGSFECVEKIELGGSIYFEFFYKLLKISLKKYDVVRVSRYWIEILPKGTNKVNMVKYLVKKYHISLDDLYIFGDGENDIEMLKYAKNSYAPSNAMKHVKTHAKHECDTPENLGVVKAIY